MSAIIELMRPFHWVKNLAVLVALPFGWLAHGSACIWPMVLAVVSFCLASSACYTFNDVLDRHEDLLHPQKKNRPVARGAISVTTALALGVILTILAMVLAGCGGSVDLLTAVGGYLLLTLSYSLYLKHEPILDVIIIACGFVVRTVGGVLAVNVFISPWLVVCTFTLCLFLGFGKRRSEITMINNAELAARHRQTLVHYSPDLLNQLLSTTAGIALVTFMLYLMDTEKMPGQEIIINKRPLLFTFPLVAYGLFRYALLIESGKISGPIDALWRDRTLGVVILLWVLLCAGAVFLPPVQKLLIYS
ncbi:MAG: Decaprenyl-phosphate phosphoribosyltransferase [Phycisphaerae bacterium]|nr:Decaprenyl-phosphate phosphoribosyltransferase [Phycisphaerae bacterium]